MKRVVILGRGGAGKSTLARRLGEVTGLPVIELDARFWTSGLEPTPNQEWVEAQTALSRQPRWIMDGDLGPYDVPGPRLKAADTIVVLDLGLLRCAWRALRRSRERRDFWLWMVHWRRRSRPALLAAARAAPGRLVVLRSPRAVDRWLAARRDDAR